MKTRHYVIVAIMMAFTLGIAACGSAKTDEKEVAVAVALTQTVAAQAAPTPTAVAQPTPASVESWPRFSAPVGFTLQYPPHWQQAALPPQNDGLIQGVALSGPEGRIELLWGEGFGGACPQGTQPIDVAQGQLEACYTQNPDGTASWEQMGQQLGSTGFSARAQTHNADSASRELILQVFSTLAFDAEAAEASPATHTVLVRVDPAQAPPESVVIYAEIPGAGPATPGESYFMAEGPGGEGLALQLPPAGYLIYGYSTVFEDISYFGAWSLGGGLEFIDGAAITEVVLSRPPDPCDPAYQLAGSPDGRFGPTDAPELQMRFGCAPSADTMPPPDAHAAGASSITPSVAGAGDFTLNLTLDGAGDTVYLQLDPDQAAGDGSTGDLWPYFAGGLSYLQPVNGATPCCRWAPSIRA